MKKEPPLKLDSEILNQLAPSKRVEIVIEQTKAIEQLKSRVVELKKNTGTTTQQRFRQYNIIKTSIAGSPQKKQRTNQKLNHPRAKHHNGKQEGNQDIREKREKGLAE